MLSSSQYSGSWVDKTYRCKKKSCTYSSPQQMGMGSNLHTDGYLKIPPPSLRFSNTSWKERMIISPEKQYLISYKRSVKLCNLNLQRISKKKKIYIYIYVQTYINVFNICSYQEKTYKSAFSRLDSGPYVAFWLLLRQIYMQ